MASSSATENFQLKWHSYGAHLHTSVATLLHSESFTDVILVTNCGTPIAAHRFVLAACSSYLSNIFQTCHIGANNNSPLVIVSNANLLWLETFNIKQIYQKKMQILQMRDCIIRILWAYLEMRL